MIGFYEIVLEKHGKEHVQKVVGTVQQVNDYAISEASKLGAVYKIYFLASFDLDGIKNLANN